MSAKIHRILLVPALLPFLSACGAGWFIDPVADPVIEDKIGLDGHEVLGTLATTAERRTVLVALSGDRVGSFCAEPSPDTAENIASSLKLLLQADVDVASKAGGSLASELSRGLSTAVQSLTKRSQGLMLYRDGSYSFCQAYLNGVIGKKEFSDRLDQLLDISKELILEELRVADGSIGGSAPPERSQSPIALVDEEKIQALTLLRKTNVITEDEFKAKAAGVLSNE